MGAVCGLAHLIEQRCERGVPLLTHLLAEHARADVALCPCGRREGEARVLELDGREL